MKRNRSGLYNPDTNKDKSKKLYGDGKTPSAYVRKRRLSVQRMNRGGCVGEETLKMYNIHRLDIEDIRKVNWNVLNYFNTGDTPVNPH